MTGPIEKQFVSLSSYGEIAYIEAGAAPRPPVLFVHGIPTSSYLWRHVLRFLQNDFHCYAPDLMGLGDTRVDPTGRFDMEAQAEMLVDFMAACGHETFGLVCHDQGGAAAQLIAARLPQRVRCFVITDAVCYDNWPVPAIARLQTAARLPSLMGVLTRLGLMEWLERRTPLSSFRRGVYRPEALEEASIREFLRPMRESVEGLQRFRSFLLAGHPRYTQMAIDGLKEFDEPTAIFWAADDYYISPSWGRKLYEDIPGAERFELVPFCGHFWQEERPSEFSSLIGEFLAKHLLSKPPAHKKPAKVIPVTAATKGRAKKKAAKPRKKGNREDTNK